MLVLTRQLNAGDKSTLCIGPDIEITLVEVRGDQVRIGIQAPRDVTVHRAEVYQAIQQENQAASQASPAEVPQSLSGAASLPRMQAKK